MKHLDDEAKYFSLAFIAEITTRGRGIQKELSRVTGISTALISDLKKGRTVGSHKNRQALAKALGYSYMDFIAKGRTLAEEKPGGHETADSLGVEARYEQFRLKIKTLRKNVIHFRAKASILAQKLITMQEKHIAFQEKYITAQDEIMQLRMDNENLRQLRQDSEGLRRPPVGGARTAPVIDAE